MIDHATGFIHTVAGDGQTGADGPIGDGGPATSAHLFMPSDVQIAQNGDLYIADMQHNRIRKVDATTRIITTVAGNGLFGAVGRQRAGHASESGRTRRPRARRGRPRPPDDLHRRLLQRHGPGGRPRRHHAQRQRRRTRQVRCAVARRVRPRTGWLYVADSSNHQVVALNIPRRCSASSRAASVAGSRPHRPRRPKGRLTPAERARSSPGCCRFCGRTAGACRCWRCCCCSRSAWARCSRGRSRLSSTTCSAARSVSRARPVDGEHADAQQPVVFAGHRGDRRHRAADRQSVRVGVRHAGAGGDRSAHGLRPALPAVQSPAVARPPSPHHDEHERRGLPRRRRRVFDREPRDERHLSARHVGHDAVRDVRDPRQQRPHDRAAVAGRRAVSVLVPPLLHDDARQPGGARQGARVEAARTALRDVLGDAAGQELRARAVRGARGTPTRASKTMHARIAHHVAAVAVLGRRQHDHHPRHRRWSSSSAACT